MPNPRAVAHQLAHSLNIDFSFREQFVSIAEQIIATTLTAVRQEAFEEALSHFNGVIANTSFEDDELLSEYSDWCRQQAGGMP